MSGKKSAGLIAPLLITVGAGLFLLWRTGIGQHGALIVVSPVYGPAVDAVYATAVVEPRRWSEVAPLRTGRIVEVLYNEGVRVPTGVPLARMDDGDLRAQLAEANSDVEFRNGERDRAEKLLAEKNISQQRYDEIRTALEQAMARQKMLDEQIRQMTVFAPINGMILWRDVEPGEVKQSGQTIFWIGEPKPLRLEAEVDEQDIPRIRRGQKVLITADAFSGQVLQGTVDSITPKGDPVNKSYRVFMSLPENTPLMIGMTVETNTVIRFKPDAVLVPSSALRDKTIWSAHKRQDGAYEARKITAVPGVTGEKTTEVLEGVSIDDLVISDPPSGLSDGKLVRIEKMDWPPAEKGGLDAMVEQMQHAGVDLTPSVPPPPLPGAGTTGGCNQSYSTPQSNGAEDDKYTKLRKEWQSRGTCFPNIAPTPETPQKGTSP